MNHASFLAAIAAEPGDDTLRLVYADFLDDAGESGYADFVRAQVALTTMDAAGDAYPETLARARRSGVLTGAAGGEGRTWLRGARVQLRRGCIADVRMGTMAYLSASPTTWDGVPVECLSLDDTRGFGTVLAHRSELRRVPGLHFAQADGWVNLLLSGDGLPRLKRLRCSLDPRGTDFRGHLLEPRSWRVPVLDSLRLDVPAEMWRGVPSVDAPLRRVHLVDTLDFPALAGRRSVWSAFSRAAYWPSLESLALRGMMYGGGIEDQPASPPFPRAFLARIAESGLRRLACPADAFDDARQPAIPPMLRSLTLLAGDDPFPTPMPHAELRRVRLSELVLGRWINGLTNLPPESWSELRRLAVLSVVSDNLPEILRGPWCADLLRLDLAIHDADGLDVHLAGAALPRVRRLTLGGFGATADFNPARFAQSFPDLCTLVFTGVWGDIQSDSIERLASGLAVSGLMPHLSLVGAGSSWWVIADGKATPALRGIAPLGCDWWEADSPDDDVFPG